MLHRGLIKLLVIRMTFQIKAYVVLYFQVEVLSNVIYIVEQSVKLGEVDYSHRCFVLHELFIQQELIIVKLLRD